MKKRVWETKRPFVGMKYLVRKNSSEKDMLLITTIEPGNEVFHAIEFIEEYKNAQERAENADLFYKIVVENDRVRDSEVFLNGKQDDVSAIKDFALYLSKIDKDMNKQETPQSAMLALHGFITILSVLTAIMIAGMLGLV